MKKGFSIVIKFALAAVLAVAALAVSGCAGKYTEEEKETATMCEMGEPSTVTYKYGFFGLTYGPYVITVTPKGLTTVNDNGTDVECIEMVYNIVETEDGEPADFAASSCVVELMNSNLDTIKAGTWYSDKEGTRIGATHDETLPIGEDITLYLAIPDGSQGSDLKYFTVSGRGGVSARTGEMFMYEL